jgi:hypothetical protein
LRIDLRPLKSPLLEAVSDTRTSVEAAAQSSSGADPTACESVANGL